MIARVLASAVAAAIFAGAAAAEPAAGDREEGAQSTEPDRRRGLLEPDPDLAAERSTWGARIRRVLRTFPGVFSGIGEFTIHKEFVSSKIAGDVATLTDPALDRVLDFAAEAGLVVIIHNDIDVPYPSPDQEPYELRQMAELFRRHPRTQIIWGHCGVGRVVRPLAAQAELLERALADPALAHVSIDISWTETAKYIVATPDTIRRAADAINRFPDRFLFGTDEVAPRDEIGYLRAYRMYEPLFAQLTPEASEKLRKGNYERLFDEARRPYAPGRRRT